MHKTILTKFGLGLAGLGLALVCTSILALGQGAPVKQISPGVPQSKAGLPNTQTKAPAPKAVPKQAAPAQRPLTLQEGANILAQNHQAWAVGMDSPLASISVREIKHEGAMYTFHLYASGMSTNKLYNILAWPVNQPRALELVKGIALDPTGRAICPGQLGTCGAVTAPNEPPDLNITLTPGRPLRLGLVAQDQSEYAFLKTIPIPLRATDKACTLEVVTLTMSSVVALLEGSGFPPNAEVDMQLTNSAEPMPKGGKSKVDANGVFSAAIMPVVEGTQFGTMSINVKSPSCSPSVSFDWGTKPAPVVTPAPPAGAPVK